MFGDGSSSSSSGTSRAASIDCTGFFFSLVRSIASVCGEQIDGIEYWKKTKLDQTTANEHRPQYSVWQSTAGVAWLLCVLYFFK